MQSIRPIVFIFPISILIISVIWSLLDIDAFFAVANTLNSKILDGFGSLFAYAVFGFVISCIWVYFSPIGNIKIGGEDAKPLLSKWNWASITICTTIATGILFWAMGEPMFHLYDNGNRNIEIGSDAARQFSLISLFMHWAFSPYAIYAVASLAFALSIHNLGKGSSLSGPLSILFGKLPQVIIDILDALILLSLVLGMAASLGTGLLLLSGGISNLTGIASSNFMQLFIAIIIVIVILISSITGLTKGIRILSDINIKFFFAIALFIFIFGPSLDIINEGSRAALGYVKEFIPRSLLIGESSDRTWANSWTIFYWANWLAWAPVTAMFLGKIARGYTVRAFITVNLIIPSLFTIFWMSILGVFAMNINDQHDNVLKTSLDNLGVESVAFKAFEYLPLSGFLIFILLFLSFLSYVTAADSNAEAIRMICQKTKNGDETSIEEHSDDHQSMNHIGNNALPANQQVKNELTVNEQENDKSHFGTLIKIIWISLIGISSWIMVSYSGIDGVRMLSNLGGFPALFIVITLNIVLIKLSFQPQLLKK